MGFGSFVKKMANPLNVAKMGHSATKGAIKGTHGAAMGTAKMAANPIKTAKSPISSGKAALGRAAKPVARSFSKGR